MKSMFAAGWSAPHTTERRSLPSRRRAHSRWAVMCGVDHLRQYEDIYGIEAGGEIQGRIFDLVSGDCRTADLILRRGRAGLVMVLAAQSLEGAKACADRHRASVESLQVFHQGSPLGVVTVSMGVANLDSSDGSVTRAELEHASSVLDHARSGGQNRVAPATAIA